MADYRGIFSLQELYEEQQSDNWAVAKESSFTKPPYSLPWNYGYVAGGTPAPGLTSTVQRMDMSNDNNVNSVRGPLTRAAYVHDGIISSDTHGYFLMGSNGYGGPYTTDINRIEYANDTINAVPKGNLAVARTGSMSSNTSYGYNAGGYNGSNAISTVDRIDFSNDTANATPKGSLSAAKYRHTGVGNQDYGYASAGSGAPVPPAPARTYIDRIDYSNDSATALNRVDMGTYSDGQATGNADYGYFYKTAETLKYDYANDTTALTPVGIFGTAVYRSGGISNSQYGYVMGGSLIPGTNTSLIQRTDFSNDTATLAARGACSRAGAYIKTTSNQSNGRLGSGSFNLSVPNNQTGITTTGTSVNTENPSQFNYGGWGYFVGGYDIPPRRSSVERIDLSNDTVNTTQRANMSQIKQEHIDMSSLTHGYATGGYNGSSTVSSTFRIDFSNDTSTPVTSGPFTRIITTTHACGTSDYSWTGGGGSPNSVSNIERYDFSNDSATGLSRGNLDEPKQAMMAVGNLNYGYYAGGYFSSPVVRKSNVSRIEYANDTATATPKANLPEIRQQGSPISNIHYGYLFGGYNGSTGTTSGYRLDYSNDNAQASPRLNMITQLQNGACFSNHTYGYIGGGYASAETSSIQRVDFANDTATCLTRGVMVETRAGATGHHSGNNVNFKPLAQINDLKGPLAVATPGQQYAYTAGGQSPTYNTRIERLNYANDSNQTITKGNLQQGRNFFTGAGNQFYGYFGGGWIPGETSVVDRIDYSNDSNVAARVGPLSRQRYYNAAASNTNYGWFAGGVDVSTYTSVVDRIDFSNDAAAASPKGPLTQGRGNATATGNANYGWFGGGSAPGVSYSIVDRIDYSNDTPTASPKGNLTHGRYGFGATGNANYGWFGGGVSPSGNISIVDRIDYSNDTPTASPKGPLSAGRYYCPATGNASYGYWFGGQPATYLSFIDRIDFSNDTATAVKRTYMTTGNAAGASLSASMNALPQG